MVTRDQNIALSNNGECLPNSLDVTVTPSGGAAPSQTVTVDSSFSYDTGETIAVGNYIVEGPWSSTHVTIDDMVERYLIAYATFKILQRDSNLTDLQVQQNVLLEMESEIIESYAEISDDIMEIPNIISEDDDWYF